MKYQFLHSFLSSFCICFLVFANQKGLISTILTSNNAWVGLFVMNILLKLLHLVKCFFFFVFFF